MRISKNEFPIKCMDFALNILKNNEKDNALVSPVSVIMALGLAAGGAKGDTKNELLRAVSMDEDALNEGIRRLLDSSDTGSDQIKYANGIWVNGDDRIVKAYKKKMKEEFRAKVRSDAFSQKTADKINKFVNENTDGMIEKLVDTLSPAASMILINALSFSGKWDKPFEDYQVDDEAIFTTASGKKKRVSMLCGSSKQYFELKNAKGFLYPYENKKYTFAAILPDKGKSVSDILKASRGEDLLKALANPLNIKAEIGIPEYTLDFEAELSDTLKILGVNSAFAPGKADFSGMLNGNSNDFISQILHKTHIELDREGTRAAAITGVLTLGAAPPLPGSNIEVILDRPFIYFILDNADKTPVFVGRADNIGH